MPYGRRYTPYKKRYNGYRKPRYSSTRVLAKKALTVAKKAYRLPELKYNDQSIVPTTVSGTGSINELSVMAQGSSNNQRIGDMVKPTSVKYRCTMKINAAATDTLIRMIIFRWVSEEPSTAADVLANATVQSFKSEDKRYQSEILVDRVYRISSVERPELFIKGSVKLNKPISYAGGGNVANRNGIWVLFTSDEAVNTPTIAYQARLFYRDP